MSTILDALRRAQKTEDDAAGKQPAPPDPAHPESSGPPQGAAAPPPGPSGSRFDPPETSAPSDPDDDGFDDDIDEKPALGIVDRLKALPIPAPFNDKRALAVIVGGLVVGLGLAGLAGLFGGDEPAQLELPASVAQKIAATQERPAADAASAPTDEAATQAQGDTNVGQGKPAKAGKGQKSGKAASGQVPTGASAQADDSTAPSPTPAPPTEGSPAAPSAGVVVPPAPSPSPLPPAEPVAPPVVGQAPAQANPSLPVSAGKPQMPKPLPANPLAGTPGPLAAAQPMAPASPTLAQSTDPSVQPDGDGLALEAAPDAAQAGEFVAEEPLSFELLPAPPEGAPQVDLLFIRWKPVPSERVASVRTGGQRIVVLHENDIIEGMKVSEIQRSGIEFQWRGQRFVVLAARY